MPGAYYWFEGVYLWEEWDEEDPENAVPADRSNIGDVEAAPAEEIECPF